MTVDLTSVNAKLDRAFEHLDALNELIRRFGNTYPYVIQYDQLDDQRTEWQARLAGVRQQSTVAMSVVIGDCAHNFRSALDHLVAAIARDVLSADDFAKVEHVVQFPICTSEDCWKGALGRGRLKGVTGERLTKIKGKQPFNTHNPANNAPLALLANLDDIDKHRLLHTVIHYMAPLSLPMFDPPLRPPADDFMMMPGPYTEGSAIFRVRFAAPRPHMHVELPLGIYIVVEESPGGEPIWQMLLRLGRIVQRLVVEIANATP